MSKQLDRWVPSFLRNEIEQRFYAKISKQADFNRLARDPLFMATPNQHIGLYADHGIGHVRDVANQLLTVLINCHGVLIPTRNWRRFTLMQGYGVLLAYFHDIGMVDFSSFGRAMHPEFAAQAVFDPDQDDLVESIWRENSAGLAWHLRTLADKKLLRQEPQQILREMLSLSVCHSKSKIPVSLLNNPARLRDKMIAIVTTNLHELYFEQQSCENQPPTTAANHQQTEKLPDPKPRRAVHSLPENAYCWLIDDHPTMRQMVEDVIDTLRALRAADALRHRGTVLVTSAGYQIFIDQNNGRAVYALRLGEDQLYLLEMSDPISAGEANIASSELEASGNLRISFHHGSFSNPGAVEFAAFSAAAIIQDIQRDAISSFIRPADDASLKRRSEMLILLEETEDNPSFIRHVQDELHKIDPEVSKLIRLTPSLKQVYPLERDRYLATDPLNWNNQTRQEVLVHLAKSGHPVQRIDIDQAFNDVRLAELNAEDLLVEAGTPSSFVYLPLGPGLKIFPLGGYQSFYVQPWMFLGIAGAVRNAERSATIIAERRVQVLMIPRSTYLSHWHQTLSLTQFQAAISAAIADSPSLPGSMSNLEKSILLQAVPLFKSLNQKALLALASQVSEVHIAAGEILFVKESIGRCLFVVVNGSLYVHDETLELAKLGPGDVVGEMAAVTPEPRTASVTAVENSILLQLDQRDLNKLLDSNPSVARGVIDVLASYVRERIVQMAELKKQLNQ